MVSPETRAFFCRHDVLCDIAEMPDDDAAAESAICRHADMLPMLFIFIAARAMLAQRKREMLLMGFICAFFALLRAMLFDAARMSMPCCHFAMRAILSFTRALPLMPADMF